LLRRSAHWSRENVRKRERVIGSRVCEDMDEASIAGSGLRVKGSTIPARPGHGPLRLNQLNPGDDSAVQTSEDEPAPQEQR